MKSLVVEDNATERRLLEILLRPFGECHSADDGPLALRKLSEAEALGRPFDLICLDIRLPTLDGQAVLKAVRSLETGRGVLAGQGVKILMTTVLDDSGSVMEAFREQCDGYVVKPVDCRKLRTLLAGLELIPRFRPAPLALNRAKFPGPRRDSWLLKEAGNHHAQTPHHPGHR